MNAKVRNCGVLDPYRGGNDTGQAFQLDHQPELYVMHVAVEFVGCRAHVQASSESQRLIACNDARIAASSGERVRIDTPVSATVSLRMSTCAATMTKDLPCASTTATSSSATS